MESEREKERENIVFWNIVIKWMKEIKKIKTLVKYFAVWNDLFSLVNLFNFFQIDVKRKKN